MERLIAYHCAPALAGIKPANIVTCYKNKVKNIHGEIERLNSEMNGRGIYFEPLCECERRVVVMVYRKEQLMQALLKPEAADFLRKYGYKEGCDCEGYIVQLKKRLLQEGEFPHEIGVFLGYPLHDICGFVNPSNRNCLLCGEWKVYENAEAAKELFHRFNACRRAVAKKVESGKKLAQMFV